jgi:hypothetical protein
MEDVRRLRHKYKNTKEALNYAIIVIKAYALECEHLQDYIDDKERPIEQFCQGAFFKNAIDYIKTIEEDY